MSARKRTAASVMQHKKASVSLSRNGVCIEVSDVPAEDAGIAAKELLDVFRTLVKAGYDELVQDAGSLHAGAFGEMPDEDGIETDTDPTQRRVGFR
jgi:hypothetical protein